MAVVGPAAGLVGGDEVTQLLARLDVERVFVRSILTVPVLQLAPEAVQMDRVLHHRIVDQYEAHPLARCRMIGSASENFFPSKPQMKRSIFPVRCNVISREGGRGSLPGRSARKSA